MHLNIIIVPELLIAEVHIQGLQVIQLPEVPALGIPETLVMETLQEAQATGILQEVQ